ncbi:adenylosuccinate lyase [Mesoplasma lactucae]|uniref:Adenylosuccinate lyase n=1 Tax=Mesoplasma lactucae ATCC 49193 TaxID=81460 RepID=A0A291IS25_9MOLU|nr:adenylosuccinate lyase [Mesoplasma lactucae]ATG97735.1 adenylosuccinate lyase [Mesoplasma lactucae ATCC 49193]ATZ20488.1 adenylosuccinate lyase [Mesoplasma lactucae ATCC 49193]MCL8216659.1 Adenylosuccinate lyase [Mesoplasma lactucae ATCC 49193]
MIDRYEVKEIADIWDDDNKLKIWTLIEELVVEGWSKIGVVPQSDVDAIKKNIKIDRPRMLEIEKETKHDVVAFTRMLSESLGDERKWIHLGITSTDIVDTAQNYMVKQSSKYVLEDIKKLEEELDSLSKKYKDTLIMGRTHGMYGEPTSLGLKFLLWLEEVKRQEKRLRAAFDDVCVTKISGSMGNYANLEISVEEYVAGKLGMKRDNLSTQVSQRDRLASLYLAMANLSTTFEKVATEIRLLQRSEVKEIMEGFSKNQKGSSSMPHKKNPISSENITGLSRMLRAYIIPGLENNVLWHERDISHSSNERIILPDSLNLVCYIARRLTNVLENIVVNEDAMLEHINSSNNIFYSQPLMTFIIMNTNHSREEVYDFVQKCTMEAMKDNKDFKQVLIDNDVYKYISKEDFDKLFNPNYFLRNVDEMYKKVNN